MHNKNLLLNRAFKKSKIDSGFTIVELLVVIVIIGILAAITMVSYSGITTKAISATLQSDLKNASTVLEMDKVINGSYPATMSAADSGKGLPKSADTDYQYTITGSDYCLSATTTKSGTLAYNASSEDGGKISEGVCSGHTAPGGEVTMTSGWKQISAGGYFACAISYNDLAYCWGSSSNGELGNNSNSQSNIPTAVDTTGALNGKTIKSIAAGHDHACAIASDNLAYCWGKNDVGQLGDNTNTNSSIPVAVNTDSALNGKTIKSITAGSNQTCAIASDNLAYCWGDNQDGQLGDNTNNHSPIPVAVDTTGVLNNKTIKSISAGFWHTCAIASDNLAYCWGSGGNGALGNGFSSSSSIPVAVSTSVELAGKTILSVAAGSAKTCVIASDNQAYCWGNGDGGELGNNTNVSSLTPVAVYSSGELSGKTIKLMSSNCAIASDNLAYCWGYNGSGQIGNNSTSDSLVPVAVDTNDALNEKTIKSITFRDIFTCTIASDDQAYCWGANFLGMLGNNSTSDSTVPVKVTEP